MSVKLLEKMKVKVGVELLPVKLFITALLPALKKGLVTQVG